MASLSSRPGQSPASSAAAATGDRREVFAELDQEHDVASSDCDRCTGDAQPAPHVLEQLDPNYGDIVAVRGSVTSHALEVDNPETDTVRHTRDRAAGWRDLADSRSCGVTVQGAGKLDHLDRL
jgi:hypothetical protein